MNSLNRVIKRTRARLGVPTELEAHARRVGPMLMASACIVYLLIGAAAFLALEHAPHENEIRRFHLNFAVRR